MELTRVLDAGGVKGLQKMACRCPSCLLLPMLLKVEKLGIDR